MRSACTTCGAALVATLAVVTLGCGGGQTPSAEDCSPTLYPAIGGVTDGTLRDVDLSDASDVWAVGGAPYFDEESSLVVRWDGRAWSRIESPADIWHYQAVAVIGSDDVWAIGRTGKSFGEARVTHWDGEAWSEPPFPAADVADAVSVAAAAGDDVWVGGGKGTFALEPYLANWDGESWKAVKPKERVPSGIVNGLAAIASNDVWAIVSVDDAIPGAVPAEDVFRDSASSLVLHWDGSEWITIPSPGPHELEQVTAVGPNDVWVASRETLHQWNGHRWTTVGLPLPDMYIDGLDHAEGAIWIAGTDLEDQEVVARYDGSTWSQAALPDPTLGADYRGIAAVSNGTAWSIGVRHQDPVHAPATQLSCIDR